MVSVCVEAGGRKVTHSSGRDDGGGRGGEALAFAVAGVCFGGGRLMQVTEGGDGSFSSDGGGEVLTTAVAGGCVGGGRLMQVTDGGDEGD